MFPSRGRLLLAVATLPILQAVIALAAFPLVWQLGGHGAVRLVDEAEAARAFALLTGFLGLFVILVAGIPVALWLIRHARVSLSDFLLAGVVMGNLPFALYIVGLILPFTVVHLLAGTMSDHLLPGSELLLGAARAILIGSVFGTISAAMFWVMAVWQRGSPSAG